MAVSFRERALILSHPDAQLDSDDWITCKDLDRIEAEQRTTRRVAYQIEVK